MSPSIELVQFAILTPETTVSAPCGKVHMALRFKGLPYEVRNVATPMEVKKYNPRGRVPVLIIDGETLVDSTDIVTALDERFPDPPLNRTDPRERAEVKLLEDWADEVAYFYGLYLRFAVPENFARLRREVFGQLPPPMRWIVPPLARRMLNGRMQGQGIGTKDLEVVRREAEECLDTLEQLLSDRSFLVGDVCTRADLAVAAVFDQWAVERLCPDLCAAVRQRAGVEAWRARVHELAPGAAE